MSAAFWYGRILRPTRLGVSDIHHPRGAQGQALRGLGEAEVCQGRKGDGPRGLGSLDDVVHVDHAYHSLPIWYDVYRLYDLLCNVHIYIYTYIIYNIKCSIIMVYMYKYYNELSCRLM